MFETARKLVSGEGEERENLTCVHAQNAEGATFKESFRKHQIHLQYQSHPSLACKPINALSSSNDLGIGIWADSQAWDCMFESYQFGDMNKYIEIKKTKEEENVKHANLGFFCFVD